MPLPPCPSASLKQQVTCWPPLDRGTDTSVMISAQSTMFPGLTQLGSDLALPLRSLSSLWRGYRPGAALAGRQHARQAGAHQGRPLGTCTGSELSGGGRLTDTDITNPRTRAATLVRRQPRAQHCMHITSFNPPVETHQAVVVGLT